MLIMPEDVREILQIVRKRREATAGYVRSAVLMLLFNREEQTQIIYIRRTRGLNLHSGQMAFPGGKIEPQDDSSYATAVRETEEEIGVTEAAYRYLGDMGYFETLTSGYDAVAHVAFCGAPLSYRINAFEVAEVIEIPLQALIRQFRPNLDFSDHQEIMYLNFKYRSPQTGQAANLWGLTARITHHFLQGLTDLLKA